MVNFSLIDLALHVLNNYLFLIMIYTYVMCFKYVPYNGSLTSPGYNRHYSNSHQCFVRQSFQPCVRQIGSAFIVQFVNFLTLIIYIRLPCIVYEVAHISFCVSTLSKWFTLCCRMLSHLIIISMSDKNNQIS